MPSISKKIIALLLVCLIVSGCGTTAKFVYPSKQSNMISIYDRAHFDFEVAVLPFDENRSDNNQYGTFFLYLIPLMPFGFIDYDRPDAANFFCTIGLYNFTPSEDLPKAVVASCRKANLFKDVYFSFGGDKDSAEYILTGEIESLHYNGKLISYGLSAYGPLLWFVGLPASISKNELQLKLALTKKGEYSPIWEFTINKELSIVQGLYYRYGHDCKGYVNLMENGMNEAMQDLNKTLLKMNLPIIEKR